MAPCEVDVVDCLVPELLLKVVLATVPEEIALKVVGGGRSRPLGDLQGRRRTSSGPSPHASCAAQVKNTPRNGVR
jgi:hypothetical protein